MGKDKKMGQSPPNRIFILYDFDYVILRITVDKSHQIGCFAPTKGKPVQSLDGFKKKQKYYIKQNNNSLFVYCNPFIEKLPLQIE